MREFDRLVEIMATLRGPDGCPWDREQTIDTLKPFVLEETYEVLEAIDRHDHRALCEELGDFVFEAVFLAQLESRSEEHTSELQSRFDLVCRLLLEKKKKKDELDPRLKIAVDLIGGERRMRTDEQAKRTNTRKLQQKEIVLHTHSERATYQNDLVTN